MFPHFDAMGGWVGWGREPRRERTHGGNAVMEDGKEMSRRHALRLKLDAGVMSLGGNTEAAVVISAVGQREVREGERSDLFCLS